MGKSHFRCGTFGAQPAGPPKKSVTMMADMVMVFMYSARKKIAKRNEEYSVWNPPTNSLSASTTSKGGRLSSAVIAMTKTTKGTTPSRMRFQCQMPWACEVTMLCTDNDPVTSTTVTIVMPRAAS